MKLYWFMCLLIAKVVSASYGDVIQGTRLENEVPVHLDLCPVYDDPNHVVYIPYQNDCRKYYICLNGQGYPHQCPDNYYWSHITYRCDLKQFSDCAATIDYPDTISYSSFPGDCSRYQETRTLSCPPNQHWNARLRKCDQPQFAGCGPIIPTWNIPEIHPTAATPPTGILPSGYPDYQVPIDPDYLCQSFGQNYYIPYPGDCRKFILCGPTASVLYCPTGLYWNRNIQSCDLNSLNCQ